MILDAHPVQTRCYEVRSVLLEAHLLISSTQDCTITVDEMLLYGYETRVFPDLCMFVKVIEMLP